MAVDAIRTPASTSSRTATADQYAAPGRDDRYTYMVTNTGNVTLHAITLHDTGSGRLPARSPRWPRWRHGLHCEHVTTQQDVDRGHIANSAR